MDIGQVLSIASLVILLDGINLLTKKSKILVKLSMKLKTFCYSARKVAIARNYDKATKVMAIDGIISGALFLIISFNISNIEVSRDSKWMIILLVISVFNQLILDFQLSEIK